MSSPLPTFKSKWKPEPSLIVFHVAVCASPRPTAPNEALLKTSTSLAFPFNESTGGLRADALYGAALFQNNMDATSAAADAAYEVLIFISVGGAGAFRGD